MMTQERPGSTARGPQHIMMKLQIYNTSPHFGKGIVSMKNPSVHGDLYVKVQIQVPTSVSPQARQKLREFEEAMKASKSAEADLGIPLLDTQKGGTKRAGSTLTPQGEELLDRYLAFEKEAREAVFVAFEKHFKADDAFQK